MTETEIAVGPNAGRDARPSGVKLRGVSKVYAGDVKAVDDVNLEIVDGEFMVLVGPSGWGRRRSSG